MGRVDEAVKKNRGIDSPKHKISPSKRLQSPNEPTAAGSSSEVGRGGRAVVGPLVTSGSVGNGGREIVEGDEGGDDQDHLRLVGSVPMPSEDNERKEPEHSEHSNYKEGRVGPVVAWEEREK